MRPARPNRRYNAALWIDRFVGAAACGALVLLRPLLRRRGGSDAEPVRKLLIVKMWGIGSIVLASPLFREIERRFPGARIDFVTLRENEPILALYPQISRRYTPGLGDGVLRFVLETLAALRRIRRERYDLVLDLEFFTRFSAIFSLLAGGRRSHGFSAKGSWRGRLHDVEVPFNVYGHVTGNFLTLLRGEPFDREVTFDRDAPLALPELEVPAAARSACREALAAESGFREGRATVAVNPNAGDMALERRWPGERVVELLDVLAEEEDLNLVVTGSPGERAYVDSLLSACARPERIVNLAGKVDLAAFVALLKDARVLVTNDSGPLHLAAAAGASTVALFGPETPVLYAPLRSRPEQRHAVHYLGLPCSPCMFVHNNKVVSCWFAQAKCMTGITAGDVVDDVRLMLANEDESVPSLRLVDT